MALKAEIDNILECLQVQPVGSGYIDCICPIQNVAAFIDSISRLNIRITEFTWWCFVSNDHKPCGMGGPKNEYGTGWYSEICMGKTYDFPSNEALKQYLICEWPKSTDYKPCYTPAFWLDLPDIWES